MSARDQACWIDLLLLVKELLHKSIERSAAGLPAPRPWLIPVFGAEVHLALTEPVCSSQGE